MNKKKNKLTFSQRARLIEKKYPKAGWDPIEKRDMEGELNALMEEQEQVRTSMGLTDQEQMAGGGKMKYQAGSFIPTDYINPITNSPTQTIIDSAQPLPETNQLELDKLNYVDRPFIPKGESFMDKNKQYLPYAASGLSNIASNLILANMAKRNQPRMSPAMAIAERINLEPQAEALRKQAGATKNVAMRNARNLGVNAGSALANMGAIGAQVDRGLGQNLTSLYMQQEGANVGAQNRVNMLNTQSQNRANMMNTQLDQQALENRLGYTGAALGTLPGVMRDVRADKADSEMRDVMRSYYNSLGGNNYATVGDIFSKNGFKWEVAEVDSMGRPVRMVKKGRSNK